MRAGRRLPFQEDDRDRGQRHQADAKAQGKDGSQSHQLHLVGLHRTVGRPGEIYNVSDGNPGNMRDYFDRVADLYGLARAPLISLAEARATLSPGMLSYLGESRRIDSRKLREELGVNMALGASNISFGLPERETLNGVFLGMAIARGLNCPIVDAAKVRLYILAADLSLGHDEYAMRYLKGYRQLQKLQAIGRLAGGKLVGET
mgnify:CR=1 FL=1